MKYDLHVHTNYSDGKYGPQEMIDKAIEKGLNGIAITDHDTVSALYEAEKHSREIDRFRFIPGIELGTIYNNEEVHILGYYIDYGSDEIINATKKLRENRIIRGKKILKKLQSMDININYNEVNKLSKEGFTGRAHIAKVLTNKGYVHSIDEAFKKYLNKGGPAYVERKTLSLKESIDLIKRVGGVSVLAHPGLLDKQNRIIQDAIKKGIQGIECIHSKHNDDDVKKFKKIAKENDLLVSAGSDCHGRNINGKLLLGDYFINENQLSEIKELRR